MWFILLPLALLWISGKISLVGIYHGFKSAACPVGEPFWIKVRLILGCNFCLSLPVIAALYTTIDTTISGSALTHKAALTLVMSLAILFMLRLLANPCNYFMGLISKDYQLNQDVKIVKLHKESIISFFYSLICASLIILLIRESYNVLIHAVVPTGTIEFRDVLFLIFLFYGVLVIITVTGEIVLKFLCKPVMSTERK